MLVEPLMISCRTILSEIIWKKCEYECLGLLFVKFGLITKTEVTSSAIEATAINWAPAPSLGRGRDPTGRYHTLPFVQYPLATGCFITMNIKQCVLLSQNHIDGFSGDAPWIELLHVIRKSHMSLSATRKRSLCGNYWFVSKNAISPDSQTWQTSL